MNWLFRWVLMVFTFVYCLAVFEVNTDYFTNTWGDEYDLYVYSGSSVNHSVKPVELFHIGSPVIPLNPYNAPFSFALMVHFPIPGIYIPTTATNDTLLFRC